MDTELCRLCLCTDGVEYSSVYDEHGSERIAKIITCCVGIKFRRNDGITQAICDGCRTEILNFNNVRKRCIASDQILRDDRRKNRTAVGLSFKFTTDIKVKLDIHDDERALGPTGEHETDTNDGTPIVESIDERVGNATPERNVQQDAVHEAQETKMIDELESISDCARSPTRRKGKKCKIRRIAKKYLSVIATENTDEPGFVCCGCSAVQFNSQQELEEHRFESHRKYRILDNSIRPFECDMCFKRFLTEKLLVQHKTRSYRKRRFVCTSCGLAYLTNNGLKRHEKVCNVEEKNFSCEVCGKRFLQTVTLASHRKLHQQEKAFSCSLCGKTFRKKFEITIHMVTHTEEQPYPCDICPARFKRHQALKNHQKHHVNSRPYKCDLCEESFNSFAARKFHRLTVHEGLDPFRCDQCGVSFGRRLRLTQHMKRVHGVTD